MISGAGWSSALLGLMAGIGFQGSKLSELTDAVGLGSAAHIIGKSFTTADVGSIPGIGVGAGVGITGLVPSAISSQIFSACVSSFGQSGPKLQELCDQIASACVSQLALATLVSADTPVFLGSGTVIVGSIGVSPSAWGSSISSQASSFQGSQWPNFANAMGSGMAGGVLNTGTGTLTITGSFTGSVPPGPLPGAGSGSGTIS